MQFRQDDLDYHKTTATATRWSWLPHIITIATRQLRPPHDDRDCHTLSRLPQDDLDRHTMIVTATHYHDCHKTTSTAIRRPRLLQDDIACHKTAGDSVLLSFWLPGIYRAIVLISRHSVVHSSLYTTVFHLHCNICGWFEIFKMSLLPDIRKIVGCECSVNGPFSPPPRVNDPNMHHGTCVTHVPWYMPGSLTNGFLWSRWREETFPELQAQVQHAIFTYPVRGPWRTYLSIWPIQTCVICLHV